MDKLGDGSIVNWHAEPPHSEENIDLNATIGPLSRTSEIFKKVITGTARKHHHFSKCNLLNTTLHGVIMKGISLHNCDFKDATINRCEFQKVNFGAGSHISSYYFSSIFKICKFLNSAIQESEFRDVIFDECDFANALIKHCKFINCTFVNCATESKVFERCIFDGCRMQGVEIQGYAYIQFWPVSR